MRSSLNMPLLSQNWTQNWGMGHEYGPPMCLKRRAQKDNMIPTIPPSSCTSPFVFAAKSPIIHFQVALLALPLNYGPLFPLLFPNHRTWNNFFESIPFSVFSIFSNPKRPKSCCYAVLLKVVFFRFFF